MITFGAKEMLINRTELVADEVEVSLAAKSVGQQTNHLVQSHAALNNVTRELQHGHSYRKGM
jgi:hypothetical protein